MVSGRGQFYCWQSKNNDLLEMRTSLWKCLSQCCSRTCVFGPLPCCSPLLFPDLTCKGPRTLQESKVNTRPLQDIITAALKHIPRSRSTVWNSERTCDSYVCVPLRHYMYPQNKPQVCTKQTREAKQSKVARALYGSTRLQRLSEGFVLPWALSGSVGVSDTHMQLKCNAVH
jgi:hypothetical protein